MITKDIISLKSLNQINNKFVDDESREIFLLRLDFALTKDASNFILGLHNIIKKWRIPNGDDFSQYYKDGKIIIFGSGSEGQSTQKILEQNGYDVYAYCDNYRGGEYINDKKVFFPWELANSNKQNYFFIIASRIHGHEMYQQMVSERIAPRENIFLPQFGAIRGETGQQYFDCEYVNLSNNEVFVDMGMYDGDTSLYVSKNCDYSRIIGFEASGVNVKKCQSKLVSLNNIEILNYAAWDKKEELFFSQSDASSHVSQFGNNKVIGESLDKVMKGERVTFIKMDVEGAEKEALDGSKYTIKKYKPKLAISVYHKIEDIYLIPNQILAIRDDYKFCLRHYTSSFEETILYCF